MFFKVKVEDRLFELDKLTLGEARVLKKHFGLVNLSSFDGTDPDQLVGLLYLALKRERPDATHEDLLGEIEGLDIEGFATAEDEQEEIEDPNLSGAQGAETEQHQSEDGNQETTLGEPGAQSSLSVVQG